MTTVLWWIRRDLRLRDNPAVHAALQYGETVVPVFVLDPVLERSSYVAEKREAFLLDGLRALERALRARGSRLIVRRGDVMGELTKLYQESQADAIFAQADVSPYARQRDAAVETHLPLHLTAGLTVYPFDAVHKRDGSPYVVYTPFKRVWKALPLYSRHDLLPAPSVISTPSDISGVDISDGPRLPGDMPFIAGEAEAQRRLAAFVAGPLYTYATARDQMAAAGTSQLSPYLRFGMLSARQAAVAARAALAEAEAAGETPARESAETWLDELIWREFYIAVLYHFPHVRRKSFRENLRDIQWANDPADFDAWCAGCTGYPIVDAGMRQLLATGWMHNRARMIVASFLTKDLLIDWRWGERYFMQHLIDGDPAANNGGWQWSAGTGTDAAPYFRIFNPILQGQKFDPQGVYVRRWVPELARVPEKYIHQPWTMPEATQTAARCRVGKDYPCPIVDHKQARTRTLAIYREARARYAAET